MDDQKIDVHTAIDHNSYRLDTDDHRFIRGPGGYTRARIVNYVSKASLSMSSKLVDYFTSHYDALKRVTDIAEIRFRHHIWEREPPKRNSRRKKQSFQNCLMLKLRYTTVAPEMEGEETTCHVKITGNGKVQIVGIQWLPDLHTVWLTLQSFLPTEWFETPTEPSVNMINTTFRMQRAPKCLVDFMHVIRLDILRNFRNYQVENWGLADRENLIQYMRLTLPTGSSATFIVYATGAVNLCAKTMEDLFFALSVWDQVWISLIQQSILNVEDQCPCFGCSNQREKLVQVEACLGQITSTLDAPENEPVPVHPVDAEPASTFSDSSHTSSLVLCGGAYGVSFRSALHASVRFP